MSENRFECGVCHSVADVQEGKITRTCMCEGPILANMRAHATGVGGVKDESLFSDALAYLKRVLSKIKQ